MTSRGAPPGAPAGNGDGHERAPSLHRPRPAGARGPRQDGPPAPRRLPGGADAGGALAVPAHAGPDRRGGGLAAAPDDLVLLHRLQHQHRRRAHLRRPGQLLFLTEDGVRIGLFADPRWWLSVWNTVRLAAVSVALETGAGRGVRAGHSTARSRGRGLLRTAILVPWAIPTVVSAQMWAWMYHDSLGIVSQCGADAGAAQSASRSPGPQRRHRAVGAWWRWTCGRPRRSWRCWCWPGCRCIPQDLYEAANVDGVQPLDAVLAHHAAAAQAGAAGGDDLPDLLDALRVFDLIFVMTRQQPPRR